MKTYGVLLLLLIHSHLSLPKSSMAATTRSFSSENDKQALLAFKRNLDNDTHVLSSWNESIPYCKWEGVYCCRQHPQRVCAIELDSSDLVGPISPYIGNLSYLRSIDLHNNTLYGIVPSSIEYAQGGPVSTAGDVYSFGILLLEIFTARNPTEYMFKDGVTLHNFVEMAFPERVMDIIDPNLIAADVMERSVLNKMCESLVSVVKVGLTCSKQSPVERMSMEDVAIQLHEVREVYLANRNG
ncbi:Leucine-rich receptor-like protein kinase family protein [Rhynchospora pubera]|uniref:Leucine-rich receptor-like protein kinase family protein n=1 Tax=Rhynchospora pubera TaxID=906938 RepID=A0AAV8E8I5_9POAL|nr:Leucine-rich receptor-like protein kinase family protein [Rhynchospora pubera]